MEFFLKIYVRQRNLSVIPSLFPSMTFVTFAFWTDDGYLLTYSLTTKRSCPHYAKSPKYYLIGNNHQN